MFFSSSSSIMNYLSSLTDIFLRALASLFYLSVGLLFLVAFILLLNRVFTFDNTLVKTLIIFTLTATAFSIVEQPARPIRNSMKTKLRLNGYL